MLHQEVLSRPLHCLGTVAVEEGEVLRRTAVHGDNRGDRRQATGPRRAGVDLVHEEGNGESALVSIVPKELHHPWAKRRAVAHLRILADETPPQSIKEPLVTTLSKCQSWLHPHDDQTPVVEGRRFCRAHLAEEKSALRIEAELAEVQRTLTEFQAEANRHPDEAKDFIEPAIRGFLDAELKSLGLRCGSGYRSVVGRSKPEQLDVTLALDVTSSQRWSAHVRAMRHLERQPLAVHMEIAFRGKGSGGLKQKIGKDLATLRRSVQQGIDSGRGLPWTSSVLLGPAWNGRATMVMSVVHQAYHDTPAHRVTLSGSKWWPYIDAFVMPGVLYKKNDLFRSSDLTGPTVPCHSAMPSGDDSPLRPLAIARGFLMHRVRILMGRQSPTASSAWPTELSSALLGAPTTDVERYDAYLPFDLEPSVQTLWHHGSVPWDDLLLRMTRVAEPSCATPSTFRFRPWRPKLPR